MVGPPGQLSAPAGLLGKENAERSRTQIGVWPRLPQKRGG